VDPTAAEADAVERDESIRLDVLRHYQVLDTPPERAFDDLAMLAAHLCDAPIALVGFVDREREWFKARIGASIDFAPRDVSFGAHAIRQSDVFLVADASTDPRFAGHPLVANAPGIRFYAGAPIATDGRPLGTIAVMDRVPRELSDAQLEGLRALARQAASLL